MSSDLDPGVMHTSVLHSPTEPPRRPRRRLLIVGVVLIVLAIIGAALAGRLTSPSKPAPPVPTPATGQVIELARGPATVGGGGSRSVLGVPTGYNPDPQTGGVNAATNYAIAFQSPTALSRLTGQALYSAIAVPAVAAQYPSARAQNDDALRAAGANEDGVVIDPSTGQASSTQSLYLDFRPEFGAYRVLEATPQRVRVEMWGPFLVGTGSAGDLSKIKVVWSRYTSEVVWQNDDWKLSDVSIASEGDQGVSPPVPVPSDPNVAPVSFAERARLLPGWLMYGNASVQPDLAPLTGRD